jgi:hypothetical protein
MAFDPVTAIANVANTVLDRVLPDKPANDAAKSALLSMQLKGEIDAQVGQIDVDKQEAASNSIFVAGWRPFIGWACGASFVYQFIALPITQTCLVIFHAHFDQTQLPKFDTPTMTTIMLTLLGMGAMRTVDKYNGTDNGH